MGEGEIQEEPNVITIKTLTPTSEELESFDLRPGENLITFTVHSRLQGS